MTTASEWSGVEYTSWVNDDAMVIAVDIVKPYSIVYVLPQPVPMSDVDAVGDWVRRLLTAAQEQGFRRVEDVDNR